MNLYYCILIGASLVSICYAESESNDAISSQSYDRRDVPLSYKYNLIHIYSTSKPLVPKNIFYDNLNYQNHNIDLRQKATPLVNFQRIQYAPLPLKNQYQPKNQVLTLEREVQSVEHNTEASSSAYDDENNDETDVREEQEQNSSVVSITSSNARPRKYVSGFNLDLKAINNKLTENVLYASNPNLLVKNKKVNVNFLEPPIIYHKQDHRQNVPQNMFNQQRPHDGKKDEKVEKRSFFSVKAPKVDLNLARAHKIARGMRKASVNVNTSFKKLPSNPQEYFSISRILQPSKTQLYPVPNSYAYAVRRTA